MCGGDFLKRCSFGKQAIRTIVTGGQVFERAVLISVLAAGTEAAARGVLFAVGGFVP